MLRPLSGVTFNIALNAFRHATLGCLFDHQNVDGLFFRAILNVTPERPGGIPKDSAFGTTLECYETIGVIEMWPSVLL